MTTVSSSLDVVVAVGVNERNDTGVSILESVLFYSEKS